MRQQRARPPPCRVRTPFQVRLKPDATIVRLNPRVPILRPKPDATILRLNPHAAIPALNPGAATTLRLTRDAARSSSEELARDVESEEPVGLVSSVGVGVREAAARDLAHGRRP